MIKFFRNIRRQLLSENKWSNYLFYAIGEVVLVVIGILIALQINNWNNTRIKRNSEKQYYLNIKHQIEEDAQEISGNINYNNNYLTLYRYGLQIIEENDRSRMDTLGYIGINLLKYSDVHRKSNIYETMVNSGEIKLLRNNKIIERLRQMEGTYIYLNKMEDMHRDVILISAVNNLTKNIKFTTNEVKRPDELFSFEFQNLIVSFIGIMDEKNEIYNRSLDEIQAITELIDKELGFQKD